MGFFDDAAEAAKATGKKVGAWAEDVGDAAGEKVEEIKADMNAKHAADAKKEEAEKEGDAPQP